MPQLYWGCLLVGALLALVTIIFGDLLGHMLGGMFHAVGGHDLPFLQPVVLLGGITVFGGAGILLTQYGEWGGLSILIASLLIALLISTGTYFLYVRPMRNSENSTAFSLRDLTGRIAEVTVSIPAGGYGEVVVALSGGLTNEIAASFDGTDIPNDARVVVVEVKDGTLYVSPLE